MERQISKLLVDVQESIQHIESFLGDKRNFFDYRDNLMLKRAVERELEIIGEAINRLLELKPDIQIENARKIVDLRNRVIHGYDKVVDEIIWGILMRNLPVLKEEVEKMLEE